MRRLSFIVVILGLFFLFALSQGSGKFVKNLENVKVNEFVKIRANVLEENFISDNYVFIELDSNVTAVCECFDFFEGREVVISGIVQDYGGEKQINIIEYGFLS